MGTNGMKLGHGGGGVGRAFKVVLGQPLHPLFPGLQEEDILLYCVLPNM